ncbi:MAG TPA: hypothetical protein VJ617_12125 [Arthrobacter sp.]|nr:hypothetical protein [Arthrobacter sp.]
MSDTTFVHEIRPGTPVTRVTLTMDIEEVQALALVAGAAIDASVLAADHVDNETAINAQEILRWAMRAAEALAALSPVVTDDKE